MRTTDLQLQKAGSVLAPIRVLTMAVGAALKEEPASCGCQVFTGKRFASGLRLGCDLSPIESASSKCCHQNQYRCNDSRQCTFDFKWDHHGTLPPLRSISPPKYPAAA